MSGVTWVDLFASETLQMLLRKHSSTYFIYFWDRRLGLKVQSTKSEAGERKYRIVG
jgi:hypothetical protein